MGKSITQEIAAIVDAQGGSIEGYPTTIAGTLDALADTLAGSDVETGRSIADSVRAVGEHIGGGGATGLTLATLSKTGNECTVNGALIYNGHLTTQGVLTSGQDKTAEVIMYNGVAYIDIISDSEVTYTGSITYDEDDESYIVTGDASITVGGGK